jgi:hypothetical protein
LESCWSPYKDKAVKTQGDYDDKMMEAKMRERENAIGRLKAEKGIEIETLECELESLKACRIPHKDVGEYIMPLADPDKVTTDAVSVISAGPTRRDCWHVIREKPWLQP